MNAAKTALLWTNPEHTSLEYFTLYFNSSCFVLEGTVIMLMDKSPTKVTYRVLCDSCWRTQYVHVVQETASRTRRLTLTVDKNQHWQANKASLLLASGLFDVDFEASPATNTLPINRLFLKVGESRELATVWVRFPSLTLEYLPQRYTRTGDRSYFYEAPTLGFEAQLEVDEAGLIVKYGKLWMRIA